MALSNEIKKQRGRELLQVIATYEMYCDLEMRYGRDLIGPFIDGLNEEQQDFMNEYMMAKLEVLAGNAALSIQPQHKKPGAKA